MLVSKWKELVAVSATMAVIVGCTDGDISEAPAASTNQYDEETADLDGVDPDVDNCQYVANPPTVAIAPNFTCVDDASCVAADGKTFVDGTKFEAYRPYDKVNPAKRLVPAFCLVADHRCYYQSDMDGDGNGDVCDGNIDVGPDTPKDQADGPNAADNCPSVLNTDQANADTDSSGNACDLDDDNDGVSDLADNCPLVANPDQTNSGGDSKGDACVDDDDGDGVLDDADNCPAQFNDGQTDTDEDGEGNACDTDDDGDLDPDYSDCAPLNKAIFVGANEVCNGIDDDCDTQVDETFADLDSDGTKDCVDADKDGDGVVNASDNCPDTKNVDQVNTDGDIAGNACDADDDGDTVADDVDNCPLMANSDQANKDGDAFGDYCDSDCDGDGVPNGSADACLPFDDDGDGYIANDCVPGDPNIHPGATEKCNGYDDDCDAVVDEGGNALCAAWELCTGTPHRCQQNPNLPNPTCTTAAQCDDSNACTLDACTNNSCAYTAKTCDDGLKCTTDSCNVAAGCVFATKSCDDTNLCTTDTCLPATGACQNTAMTCDDGNVCTTDACSMGTCSSTAITCPSGQVCTAPTGTCQPTPECTAANVATACEDNNPCTTASCSSGKCVQTAKTCASGQTCNVSTGACAANPPEGWFKFRFTLAPDEVPSGDTEARFMYEGYNAAGGVVITWFAYDIDAITAGTPVVLEFEVTNTSLAKFKTNPLTRKGAGSPENYAATCAGVGGTNCSSRGKLEYWYWKNGVMYHVVNVPTRSNGANGIEWWATPGTATPDTDGDGYNDTVDASKFDGAVH